jgi:glutamate synthase (NADPH/NADH) large chain
MRQPRARGLYDPAFEHDSCGFGLIAQLDDRPERRLVSGALLALARLSHRGAVAADGLSGDGCGILLRRPDAWLKASAAEIGVVLDDEGLARVASGLIFLPPEADAAEQARKVLTEQCEKVGLSLLGWRTVPVDNAVCGEQARVCQPWIEQVFVQAPSSMSARDFELALYLARRRSRQHLGPDSPYYVVSLSAQVFGFKAMVLAEHLANFYLDLKRDDLAASAALFHQRFSTNTAPQWKLAQPFRVLAHNGEINTIAGNRAWARARRRVWKPDGIDLTEFDPPLTMTGSDSQTLDEMLELMLVGGMDALKALRILIPPAMHALEYSDPDLAAFYEYYALHSEPWDGPAGIVFLDSRHAGCILDRNGLRPARWALGAERHLLVASEAGVWELPGGVIDKGRLGPGQMLAVDFATGNLMDSAAIDRFNAARAPYKQWLKAGVRYVVSDLIDPALASEPFDSTTLAWFQKRFGLSREEREQVLRPLADTEAEGIGSMGDDTPTPVLSLRVRPLYDCFRQAFAQVTNPPIDPIREQVVMSLVTQLGPEGDMFIDGPDNASQVELNSPALSQRKLRELLSMEGFRDAHTRIELDFSPDEGLEAALRRLCAEAESAVRAGNLILLLSDRFPRPGRLSIHALLATGAIHNHLVAAGQRCACNLIVETGTARDPHHFACLIGLGATAVYPYLAYQSLFDMGAKGLLLGEQGSRDAGEPGQYGRRYRRGIRKGLLKILSKMGISTLSSYRGAQLFEIIGLAPEVVELCFPGMPSRVGGANFDDLQHDATVLAALADDSLADLEPGGLLKYMQGGEYHMYNPGVVKALQEAVRSGERSDWQTYANLVNQRPTAALRDLLALNLADTPLPLEQVEPIGDVLPRFDSAGMSLGALSPEAHEALAIAMNRLGGRSNSGEGGEDPARYGTEKRSKIKQIASGRFGVTPEYLVNAEVIQIKIAQGAKPGEGGQLPGHKVNSLIARLRYARPGIGLISPPPHHDIYSIEDLAQLIFDLKQVNPTALVSVKLVAHAGVGTIAAGVAKCYADLITISGHDGGTGASPLSSIRYAGVPWELGLAEAQQTLRLNGLRERVRLQVDGGLKTGLDVVKAAILGAESFGFGTGPMIALGCKYLRICHLNNCATGVATQDKRLRELHFKGPPERAMAFFQLMAEETREWLALIGARSLGEIIGRTELLRELPGETDRQKRLDLSRLLDDGGLAESAPRFCTTPSNPPRDAGKLAVRLLEEVAPAIEARQGGRFEFPIQNSDRSIGTGLSGAIATRWGNQGMAARPIEIALTGAAGQSFGAFNAGGLHLSLTGEANDGVGKGMAGGRIVVRPPADARFEPHLTPIMGNACLYGATSGELYAAGRAGERFAVRNSGAQAVIEGAGDHCCEYMTGGIVTVLGPTGLNFGAGFTGGFAYVLDLERCFVDRYNHELIDIHRISYEGLEHHLQHLRGLLAAHVEHTGSQWGQAILDDFRDFLGKFWLVKPRAASLESLIDSLRKAA